MNELSEFFSSVAKEKKRVEEEKIRFTPRVNVDLSDLSSFFGTITEAKREHVVIAKRDSTKLNALKGFFDRLDKFEVALQENIEKQKETPKDGFDPAEVEGYEEFNKNYEPKEEEKEDILDEVKDVDKWNQWVDAAEKEAIKEDQEEKDKEYVDTKNRIFYGEELKQIDEAQKKTVKGTNYITKVSNKQLRQTTNPEDSDPTSQK